jgi:hypothetical protein
MCKLNKKSGNKRIDPCMKSIVANLQLRGIKTLACCCGHGKYPMTLVVEGLILYPTEIFSNKTIPRKKRFYLKDKQGYYYIPELN